MQSFSGYLGRVRAIQISVEGHPCLDELHESRKIPAPIKIGTGGMQEIAWTDSGQSEQKR